VHVSLVIHPKKWDEKLDLDISSVFGTSKATQESDNVFMIQNRKK
jgi:twinkle protein